MTNKLASAILAGMKAREGALQKAWRRGHDDAFNLQFEEGVRSTSFTAFQISFALFEATQAERKAFEQAMEEE